MNTRIKKNSLLLILSLLITLGYAQNPSIYKIENLLARTQNNSDTLYIVNFWATWCKPCVAELPDFCKIDSAYKTKKVKVLLVSLDFKEDMDKKLIPFIKKNNYKTEIVILDESNGNYFINKVSENWSGAIPATLITQKNKTLNEFYEKKLTYEFLETKIHSIVK